MHIYQEKKEIFSRSAIHKAACSPTYILLTVLVFGGRGVCVEFVEINRLLWPKENKVSFPHTRLVLEGSETTA